MKEKTFTTTGPIRIEESIDLEECHQEPIHRAALIQPHGAFLKVDMDTLEIRSASANLTDFFDLPPEEAINGPLSQLFQHPVIEEIERWIRDSSPSPELIMPDGDPPRRSLHLFPLDDGMGIEVELDPGRMKRAGELVTRTNEEIVRLGSLQSKELLFDHTVRTLRELTGFDRVMLYRFDPDGHGQVVAENKSAEAESFLDHCFPASDIPEPARRLYRKNQLRYIPRADYEPVPILGPEGERTADELDLTHSNLRNVPLVHRKYLKNMEVASAMSLSLVVKDKLWGLIACHGLTAHELSLSRRNICKIVGTTVAQQLNWLQANERDEVLFSIDSLRDRLGDRLTTFRQLFKRFRQHAEELLSFLEANRFYIQFNDRSAWLSNEDEPPPDELLGSIQKRLGERKLLRVHSVKGELDETWKHSESTSGFLAVRLSFSPRSFCVWFRPETRTTRKWGGDPRSPAIRDETDGLSPRDSFETWTQIVENRCRRWDALDEFSAREIVRCINEFALEIRDRQLQEANVELEETNQEKDELIDQVQELARTDELTQLTNRRHFMEQLEAEVDRSRRYETPLSFALLDLDYFKDINDRFGHQMGDEVLSEIGEILKSQTRSPDITGRYGGEEFALCLPETRLPDAHVIAERILETIRKHQFVCDGERFSVTASIGLAELRDSDSNVKEFIERADEALYEAKNRGRDQVADRY